MKMVVALHRGWGVGFSDSVSLVWGFEANDIWYVITNLQVGSTEEEPISCTKILKISSRRRGKVEISLQLAPRWHCETRDECDCEKADVFVGSFWVPWKKSELMVSSVRMDLIRRKSR